MERPLDVKKERNSKVIYTAIFGGYDALQEPATIPDGFDFICFSDKKIKSKYWQVRTVEPTERDNTRNNRKYKILPHRYLGGYDVSIYIDGNFLVRGDANELINQHLANSNMAVFDHVYARHHNKERSPDVRRNVKEELEMLLNSAVRGKVKDDPDVMKRQYERYKKEGFPDNAGSAFCTTLLRRHNEPDVMNAMEAWWQEIRTGSKRDQLSFNYVAWKTGLQFEYVKENARENRYFLYTPHNKGR